MAKMQLAMKYPLNSRDSVSGATKKTPARFNHANFLDPSFDTTNTAAFGVINTQLIPADRISCARGIQLGFRIDF